MVWYENPDLLGSWTTSMTWTGSTMVGPKGRAVTGTRSPGDAGPGESTTNPLAVYRPKEHLVSDTLPNRVAAPDEGCHF